jgi:hypothetical protein
VYFDQHPAVQNVPFFAVLHGRLAVLRFKQHPHLGQLLLSALHPEEPGVVKPLVALDVHSAGILKNAVEGAGFHDFVLLFD